ncbi:endonuclease/exonuclease/phosphatase family protein [Brachybacterium hainanense]|uniref:Endonuclease/exonuclease/phosphatase family protein n=1 Tax=Brachybacterium hainanense TaxID=1541174 RepID=A0ABV6REB2_9MICO
MSPRISRRSAIAAAATGATGLALSSVEALAQPAFGGWGQQLDVRVATLDAGLSRAAGGALVAALHTRGDARARKIAKIVQINNPDILLLSGIDLDHDGAALDLLRRNYLEVSQDGSTSVHYPYAYTGPGAADPVAEAPAFPGQNGTAVLSRFPIRERDVRTFQRLPWRSMPSNLFPESHYGAEVGTTMPLSSTAHWDVPVTVGSSVIHLLVSRPVLPLEDGPERRLARRNHDELRFWADYLTGGSRASWIRDDAGRAGGLEADASALVLGTLGTDPDSRIAWTGAAAQLLDHPRLQDTHPRSDGAMEAAAGPGTGTEAERTASFAPAPEGPGDLRVDYVLPTSDLDVIASGVFWPRRGDSGAALLDATAHRLVRLDLRVDS